MSRRLIRTLTILLCLLLVGWLPIQTTRVFALSNYVSSIAWSPDGRKIASGFADGTVRIWDAEKGAVLHILWGHIDRVTTLAWSPDGKKIASGSNDKNLCIWDVANGFLLAVLTGHETGVSAAAWSPNGKEIYSGGYDESWTLRIWEAATFQLIRRETAGAIVQIVWNQDKTKISMANPVGQLVVYNATNLDDFSIFQQPENIGTYGIYRLTWSLNDKLIVSGSWNGIVRVWDVATGRIVVTLAGNDNPEEGYDTISIRDLTFTPDGKRLKSISADGTIREWDAQNWRVLSTTQIGSPFTAVAWSPDGTKIAYGDDSGNVRVIIPSTILKLDQARQLGSDATGTEVKAN